MTQHRARALTELTCPSRNRALLRQITPCMQLPTAWALSDPACNDSRIRLPHNSKSFTTKTHIRLPPSHASSTTFYGWTLGVLGCRLLSTTPHLTHGPARRSPGTTCSTHSYHDGRDLFHHAMIPPTMFLASFSFSDTTHHHGRRELEWLHFLFLFPPFFPTTTTRDTSARINIYMGVSSDRLLLFFHDSF